MNLNIFMWIIGAAFLVAPVHGEGDHIRTIECHGIGLELKNPKSTFPIMRSGPGDRYPKVRMSRDLEWTLHFEVVTRKGEWVEFEGAPRVWMRIKDFYFLDDQFDGSTLTEDRRRELKEDMQNECVDGVPMKKPRPMN